MQPDIYLQPEALMPRSRLAVRAARSVAFSSTGLSTGKGIFEYSINTGVGVKSNLVFLVNCWLVQVGVQRLLLLHPKTPCRHWVVVGPQPDLGWVVQVERAVEGGFCREIMIDLIF